LMEASTFGAAFLIFPEASDALAGLR
jgi:hypothetical protein